MEIHIVVSLKSLLWCPQREILCNIKTSLRYCRLVVEIIPNRGGGKIEYPQLHDVYLFYQDENI